MSVTRFPAPALWRMERCVAAFFLSMSPAAVAIRLAASSSRIARAFGGRIIESGSDGRGSDRAGRAMPRDPDEADRGHDEPDDAGELRNAEAVEPEAVEAERLDREPTDRVEAHVGEEQRAG